MAARWDLVPRNVALLVEPQTVPQREVVPFNVPEAHQFLEAARWHRLHAFFAMAIAVGLRPSEALGLRWSDVDLDTRVLRVRHALERRPEGYALKQPKSRTSRRKIPLPETCAAALAEHRRRQHAEQQAAGAAWTDLDLLFSTTTGEPLHRTEVSRQFKKLLESAGMPSRRLYDCRHTAATFPLAQGVSPRVMMEILGHSSFSLTMDTYAHVLPELMRDAATAMDRVLGRMQSTATEPKPWW